MWHRKAMDKEIVTAIATKFSEMFATSMLKKHRKFCSRGLTHLNATPILKNRPNTYETPCTKCTQKSLNLHYIMPTKSRPRKISTSNASWTYMC